MFFAKNYQLIYYSLFNYQLYKLKNTNIQLAGVSGKIFFKTGDYTSALHKFKSWTKLLKEMRVNNLRAG